jgi:ABC-type sulfate transport system substrate-binding protein
VHLTWENEALSEVAEAKGALEIVYPSVSILAEPPIASVDANNRKNGTTKVIEDYLKFIYSPPGQAIGAAHGYRPTQIPVPADRFPPIRLIPASTVGSWDEIHSRFFATGALFDRIQAAGRLK